jgi:hypothetical protein
VSAGRAGARGIATRAEPLDARGFGCRVAFRLPWEVWLLVATYGCKFATNNITISYSTRKHFFNWDEICELMRNTDRVVWWFLTTFGAFAPMFSLGIFFTEDKANVDILRGVVCAGLSFSSLTLCVSSLVTAFRNLSKSEASENGTLVGRCIVSILAIIILIIIISVFYWKITSKILTAEIVSVPYLLIVGVFVATVFLSYVIMRSFEPGRSKS